MPDFEIKVVKRNDLIPRCPHCEHDLPEVYAHSKGIGWFAPSTTLLFCPHCRKVLGFAQSRMM